MLTPAICLQKQFHMCELHIVTSVHMEALIWQSARNTCSDKLTARYLPIKKKGKRQSLRQAVEERTIIY